MKKKMNYFFSLSAILTFFIASSTVCMAEASTSKIVSGSDTSAVFVYTYPRISPKSSEFKLKASGLDVFVYQTSAAPFAAFSCKGSIEIEVEMATFTGEISIVPRRHNIKPIVDGKKVKFQIPGPMPIALEVDGMPQLYIYANPVENNKPDLTSNLIKYFKAGQVYEVGELRLQSNEILYIEGGAVVRGCIRSTSSENVKVSGYGVLDGGYYKQSVDSRRSIVFEDCKNSVIENIIMIEPSSWMIVLGLCENVTVRSVKELGLVSGSDGTDIVGSKHIRVENCFYRNGDDCIAIKSLNLSKHGRDATLDFTRDVEDIEIVGCTFVAYQGGTALEIGHELRTSSIRDIRFRDCDILGVHGFGGVFGIHNADRATVSDILYENIRVEHHYNKLIDLKVIKSMWGKDAERGQIRNVTFRNIDVALTIYNPGYSFSLIGGYDAKHTAENILFDNFRVDGVKVTNADQLDLYIKQASGIKFK